MANTPVVVLDDTMTDIADAIRGKNGSSDTYKPSEMPAAITAIPTGGVGIPREVSQSGVFQMPSSTFTYSLPAGVTDLGQDVLRDAFEEDIYLTAIDFSGLTSVTGHDAMNRMCYLCSGLTSVNFEDLVTISANNAAQYAFYNCTSLTSVDFSSLTTISGGGALQNAFQGCTSLASVSMPNLTSVGFRGFMQAFSGCTALTSLDLRSLSSTTGDYAMQSMCNGCSNLTSVNFSGLASLGWYGMSEAFAWCSKLATVSFDSLSTVGMRGLASAFRGCTHLTSVSFPALTTSSFGTYTDQFNDMLLQCSGVTVHFPAAIQSTIGSWSSVTNGFGGTNTTVLFDL